MNLAQLSKRDWQRITIAAAVFGGGVAGALIWFGGNGHLGLASLGGLLGVLIVGLLVLLVGSMNLKINHLVRRVNETEATLQEMINIRPLLDGPPLDYGGWAMDSHLGKTLAQAIARHEPQCVLECGSGTSTVFIAQCMKREKTGGRIIALEHLERFAEKTRQMLREHEVEEYGKVVTAPLEQREVDGKKQPWYGVDLRRLEDVPPINLLVVDGPPQDTSTRARFPALPLLHEHISDECIVILDDGDRKEEAEIAQEWTRTFDMKDTYIPGGKGTWVLYSEQELL